MEISVEDYKKLVNGKFRIFKCTKCHGNGWYWVHDTGVIRNPSSEENTEDFYQHPCDQPGECATVGFRVVFDPQ